MVKTVNSTNDTLLLFTVFLGAISHKRVQAEEPAGRQACLLSVESSTAVSSPLRLVQVENAESKWPSPQKQMILFNWSGYSPWTTDISFVVYSREL